MQIKSAPKHDSVSTLLYEAERAVEALKVLNVDLDELYEVKVEIGSPIVASFGAFDHDYAYVWTRECWRRVMA